MMALNIAVPMSGVGDLLEGFGLLSPISPVSIDFRNSIKNPLSPVGSESSGVSSLDLEDIKKQIPTLLDENEEDGTSGPGKSPSNSESLSAASTMSTTSSRTCSTSSSSSSSSSAASDDYTNQLDENEPKSPESVAAVSSSSPELPGTSEKESNEPVITVDDTEALPSLDLNKPVKEASELPLFSPKATSELIFCLPRQCIIYNSRDILDLGNVSGGSLTNTQNGNAGSAANGVFFNNNPLGNNLQGRDHFNHMAPMGMQYNNTGANSKGISQPNGIPSQSSGLRQQQQQYDMLQQQKQYVNNYSLGSAATNSAAMSASSNVAVRIQQQQSQQVSHYYKKNSSMRYNGGGPAGINNMPSGGPTGSNWKNQMPINNAIHDTATKLFMELNKMQQQSPYYVPFQ
uniref:Uncharacterized protein n=1 Tax=Anopheles minimus TaxID=112268 RepID=A0A182VTX1_9DIPT